MVVDQGTGQGSNQHQNSHVARAEAKDENRRPQRRKMPLIFRKKKPLARKVIYEEPGPSGIVSDQNNGAHEAIKAIQGTSHCQNNERENRVHDNQNDAPGASSTPVQFEHDDDDDFSPVPPVARLKQRGFVSKGRIPWTVEEVQFLLKNYPKYKQRYDVWRTILDKGANVFHESRTNVSLKDKWRQLGHSFRWLPLCFFYIVYEGGVFTYVRGN